jgi:hypothetical protein
MVRKFELEISYHRDHMENASIIEGTILNWILGNEFEKNNTGSVGSDRP